LSQPYIAIDTDLDTAHREEEVQRLQLTIERLTLEKQELEARAAAQAETCQELQEANDSLSARTLALAGEATTAAENTRRQLQGQLTECQKALDQAQEEIAMLQDRNMTMMERQAEM
jgi:chromosome segregation ATPase